MILLKLVWGILFGPLRPGSTTVALAMVKHATQGAILMFSGAADKTVGLAAMLSALNWVPDGWRHRLLGIMLLGVVVCASVAMRRPNMHHRLVAFLLTPQLVFLWISCLAAWHAVILGQYADGYVPKGGALFILGDQIDARLILAPFYTIALFVRAHDQELVTAGAGSPG